jgi:hypothetical protein
VRTHAIEAPNVPIGLRGDSNLQPIAIIPGRGWDQSDLGRRIVNLPDSLESIYQDSLFDLQLAVNLHMLEVAAATTAIMNARGVLAARCGTQDLDSGGFEITLAIPVGSDSDLVSRRRKRHKHRPPFVKAKAPAAGYDSLDGDVKRHLTPNLVANRKG